MSGKVFERDGSWYYRIPAKSFDGKYTTIWKGGFENKAEAEKAKSKAEVLRDERGNVAPSKITVSGWIERWLADKKPEIEPGTYRDYSSMLKDYVVPVLGRVRLKDLKRMQVHNLEKNLERQGIHRTALKVHNVFRTCLKDAVMLEMLDRNPTDGLPAPKVPEKPRKKAPRELLLEVLAASEGTLIGEVVYAVIWTGLREGEIVRLKWADINFGRRVLYVPEAKYDSTGTIALSAGLLARMVKYRLAQRELIEKAGKAWRHNDLVFCNEIGEPITTAAIRGRWTRLRDKVGLQLSFHGLRHAHASLLIDAGMHPKMIQERMRHRDFATTMNVYGDLMTGVTPDDPALKELDELLARD